MKLTTLAGRARASQPAARTTCATLVPERPGLPTCVNGVNSGDQTRLLTLMTDGVVFLNPGQSPLDRDGSAANFLSACQALEIRCIGELEEVVAGVACTRSRDALSVKPNSMGDTPRFSGYRTGVHRRQPDGDWLPARDAHTPIPLKETGS